jgi:Protein of unknown function (DUF3089)
MKTLKYIIFFFWVLTGCASKKQIFEDALLPSAPDYNNIENWAAHPLKYDSSDLVLKFDEYVYDNKLKAVDVFFIHPTSYWSRKRKYYWNAPIDEKELNKATDEGSIQYQASVFNHIGNIYAPRYRQAHLNAYFSKDKVSGQKALDLAYQDVKMAFEHYLKYENKGKPIILASHSQGTTHARQLLKDFFDNKPFQKQLVAAYIVGIPVLKSDYQSIKPCKDSFDLGCICSWRTYKYGTEPIIDSKDIIVTNPINWRIDGELATKNESKGGLLPNNKYYPTMCDAKIYKSILWTHKPKFKGSFLITTKNYHVGDYNLFYYDIRHNAYLRSMIYLKK